MLKGWAIIGVFLVAAVVIFKKLQSQGTGKAFTGLSPQRGIYGTDTTPTH